jgi:hypothetical protein
MSAEIFDPLSLRPEASLNRTRLVELPGADASLVGRSAFDVLSLRAFHALTEDRAATFGRRVAHLIASLRQPDPRASSWRQAYLAHWRSVEIVYLGGGLSAALGQRMVEAARAEVARLSRSDVELHLAPYPAFMALIGAARGLLPAPSAPVPVFDFGQSVVKRGIATFGDGSLQHVHLLPSLPAPAESDVVEFFFDVVTGRPAVVSIASYLADDRPIGGQALYSPLAAIDRGRLPGVAFVHDGSAAARAIVAQPLEPSPAIGAVVLGTALGVGFAPHSSALVPLSPTFRLS